MEGSPSPEPAWDAATYGERFAPVYDEWYGSRFDTDGAVTLLADLAGGGRVLELGIGTGRLALPLVERGLVVHGVDASAAMVERLRAKPGGDRVEVTVGDMATADPPAPSGPYALVVVATNTLFNLDDRGAQAACLRRAATVLGPGGALVVEAFVPDPDRLADPVPVTVRRIDPDRVALDAVRVDVEAQRIETAVVTLGPDGIAVYPARLRWADPHEIDDLAAAAGLRLEARWSSWRRDPFEDSSRAHVSVYRAR